jgi:hypothetical protein
VSITNEPGTPILINITCLPGIASLAMPISFTLSRTSCTLDKYPGEVLPRTVEDDQPQNGYHGCQARSAMIQENVITE